jgi:hypothetical protein
MERAGLILAGWCGLSLVVAAAWSRFMQHLHRQEALVRRDWEATYGRDTR